MVVAFRNINGFAQLVQCFGPRGNAEHSSLCAIHPLPRNSCRPRCSPCMVTLCTTFSCARQTPLQSCEIIRCNRRHSGRTLFEWEVVPPVVRLPMPATETILEARLFFLSATYSLVVSCYRCPQGPTWSSTSLRKRAWCVSSA